MLFSNSSKRSFAIISAGRIDEESYYEKTAEIIAKDLLDELENNTDLAQEKKEGEEELIPSK